MYTQRILDFLLIRECLTVTCDCDSVTAKVQKPWLGARISYPEDVYDFLGVRKNKREMRNNQQDLRII